nr:uncharacterized protein LOC123767562 [Procambarus clarkii]
MTIRNRGLCMFVCSYPHRPCCQLVDSLILGRASLSVQVELSLAGVLSSVPSLHVCFFDCHAISFYTPESERLTSRKRKFTAIHENDDAVDKCCGVGNTGVGDLGPKMLPLQRLW